MGTSNVNTTSPGTTPFVVDVTACDLLSDLTVKDFQIFVGGTLNCTGSGCSNWTKTTATQLTYSGTAIANGTAIQIRRKTPNSVIQTINFAERFSSSLWNNELDRVIRWREEADLNGTGPGSAITVATPSDVAYPTGWDGDVIQPPTRNAVFDALQLFATLASPTFTGTPAAPTAADGTSTTQIATTAFAATRVTNALANSPALGGNPTATTQANGNDSTRIATTAFAQDLYRPAIIVRKTASQLNLNGESLINWDVEDLDTDNAFDLTTDTFTVPTGMGGLYLVSWTVIVRATVAVATPMQVIMKVNSTNYRLTQDQSNADTNDRQMSGSRLVSLSAGDTVRLYVTDFGFGGVDINVEPTENGTYMGIFRLGV